MSAEHIFIASFRSRRGASAGVAVGADPRLPRRPSEAVVPLRPRQPDALLAEMVLQVALRPGGEGILSLHAER